MAISVVDPSISTAYAQRAEGVMDGAGLRDVFEKVLPRAVIETHVTDLRIQERQRKLDVVGLLMSMVVSGGNHRFGTQSAMLERYLGNTRPKVSRAAFYSWFTGDFATLLERLSSEACAYVASRPAHLPSLLADCADWRVVDASTVKLPDALKGTFPGSGDYSALKLHIEYSLGVENIVGYTISPAREHDSRHLIIDERRRGQGLLVDLGYASHAMLDACEKHDVRYVIRVKQGWEFWFDELTSHEERERWLDNGRLDDRFGAADVTAANDIIDIDVTVGGLESGRRARLVAFTTPKGRVMFLTNLPRDTHSYAEIGLLYRLRWTIELANKLCKSAMSVEEIFARTESSARIVVHAAMLAAILAQAIAHEEHVARGWTGTRRRAITTAPIHPVAVAERMARMSGDVGLALADPETPLERWNALALVLVGLSADPNWRRRPSAIDVVKGRTSKLVNVHAYAIDPVAALGRLK